MSPPSRIRPLTGNDSCRTGRRSYTLKDGSALTAVGKVDKKALRARYWAGQEREVH
jgi:hypothetical protein